MKTMSNAFSKTEKKKFQKPNILRKIKKSEAVTNATHNNEIEIKQFLKPAFDTQKPFDVNCGKISTRKQMKPYTSIRKLPEILKRIDPDNIHITTNSKKYSGDDELEKNNGESEVLSTYSQPEPELITNVMPLSPLTLVNHELNKNSQDVDPNTCNSEGESKLDIEPTNYITLYIQYKCNVPNCNKEFTRAEQLSRHISVHNKNKLKQANIECPARIIENGEQRPCSRVYPVREELWKHLKDDHTLDDAAHQCEECGRRFFWAGGLRAHGRSLCGHGAALKCEWPGCGRTFRQPCRLREHQRAHTGDKPYPCQHPNCGWSFRTASKLMRHARQHTGERRHVCTLCGRAFLRREHLRDHAARHRGPVHGHGDYHCTHGCSQSFTNMNSLYQHVKKVHRSQVYKEEGCTTRLVSTETTNVQNDLIVSLEDNLVGETKLATCVVEESENAANDSDIERVTELDLQWHSARTHCTWPLALQHEKRSNHGNEDDDDWKVELSENNTYTVRSDLFLPSFGSIHYNEDSQSYNCGVGAVVDGGGDTGGTEGGDGGLVLLSGVEHDLGLDTHSTIDLMQEQLLFTEGADDESSSQVYLLSGEDFEINNT